MDSCPKLTTIIGRVKITEQRVKIRASLIENLFGIKYRSFFKNGEKYTIQIIDNSDNWKLIS